MDRTSPSQGLLETIQHYATHTILHVRENYLKLLVLIKKESPEFKRRKELGLENIRLRKDYNQIVQTEGQLKLEVKRQQDNLLTLQEEARTSRIERGNLENRLRVTQKSLDHSRQAHEELSGHIQQMEKVHSERIISAYAALAGKVLRGYSQYPCYVIFRVGEVQHCALNPLAEKLCKKTIEEVMTSLTANPSQKIRKLNKDKDRIRVESEDLGYGISMSIVHPFPHTRKRNTIEYLRDNYRQATLLMNHLMYIYSQKPSEAEVKVITS